MFETGHFLHFLSVTLTVGLTSLGVGIGGGQASSAAIEAINTQPKATNEISRISLLGMALIETSGVLGVVISIMLFFQAQPQTLKNIYFGIAELGILFSIGLTGCVVGLVSSYPIQQACYANARQPFFTPRIINVMLLTLSLIQTPLIFAFLVALLIITRIDETITLTTSFSYLAAGLAVGLGSIGPTIGLATFASQVCKGLGINRNAYAKLLPFTFISMAIIETPMVFSLVIALLLLQQLISASPLGIIAALSAALCVGIGTFGPGISSSITAVAAAKQISYNPEHAGVLSKTSMVAQALIDAAAIYALLVAMLIILLH